MIAESSHVTHNVLKQTKSVVPTSKPLLFLHMSNFKAINKSKVKGFWLTAPDASVATVLSGKGGGKGGGKRINLNRVEGDCPVVLPETMDNSLFDGVFAPTIPGLWHRFLQENEGNRFFVVDDADVRMATVVKSDEGLILDFVRIVTAHDVESARYNFEVGVKAWFAANAIMDLSDSVIHVLYKRDFVNTASFFKPSMARDLPPPIRRELEVFNIETGRPRRCWHHLLDAVESVISKQTGRNATDSPKGHLYRILRLRTHADVDAFVARAWRAYVDGPVEAVEAVEAVVVEPTSLTHIDDFPALKADDASGGGGGGGSGGGGASKSGIKKSGISTMRRHGNVASLVFFADVTEPPKFKCAESLAQDYVESWADACDDA